MTIQAAGSNTGDYHGNFNIRMYLHWADVEFLPGLIQVGVCAWECVCVRVCVWCSLSLSVANLCLSRQVCVASQIVTMDSSN